MERLAWVIVAGLLVGASSASGQDDTAGWIGPDELTTVVDSFLIDPGTVRIQLSRVPVTELVSVELDGVAWPDLASIRMTSSSGLLVLPFVVQELSLIHI